MMKQQLELIRKIEENERQKPLHEKLANIASGKYWNDIRAAGVSAEAYTVHQLCKCDIYVDGDQIAWEVREVFPEVSKQQVLTWLLQHAEEHHEILVTNISSLSPIT